MKFKDTDDLVEWLQPMGYETFWREIKPFGLIIIPRDKCDRDIASGATDEETVLSVMKNFARIELASILKLEWRDIIPSHAVH
ncbi:MAG: hypothetical protein ABJM43_19020 [Paracoccaceae bacterium]